MHFKAILVTATMALGNIAVAEPIDIKARKPNTLEARHTIGSWHPPENTLEARNTLDVLEARNTIGHWHPPRNTLGARNTLDALEAHHTIGSNHPPFEAIYTL